MILTDSTQLSRLLKMIEGTFLILAIENYTDDLKILNQDVGEFDSANAANLHEALWQCQSLFNDVTGKVSTRR